MVNSVTTPVSFQKMEKFKDVEFQWLNAPNKDSYALTKLVVNSGIVFQNVLAALVNYTLIASLNKGVDAINKFRAWKAPAPTPAPEEKKEVNSDDLAASKPPVLDVTTDPVPGEEVRPAPVTVKDPQPLETPTAGWGYWPFSASPAAGAFGTTPK